MPKYEVNIYRYVEDCLRCRLIVDADTADEAKAIALELRDDANDEFDFWQCGDCTRDDEVEVYPI